MSAGAGRRAILRWGWRLFRREWRQQLLVLTLLSVAVAAATFMVAFAYNVTSGTEAALGSADVRIAFDGSDPAATAADIATAHEMYDTVDVITTRSTPIPGSVQRMQLHGQDPDGAYAGPMLALREGAYPTGPDELALTDDLAQTLHTDVGDVVEIDGQSWQVVGLVENPSDLDYEFALVPPDTSGVAESVTLLVDGDLDKANDFREAMTVDGNVSRDFRSNNKAEAAIGTLGLTTVALLLVSLIAVAAFMVLGQRRLRQLGMLAAIGATTRQVRLVTLVNGVLVGLVAAVVGTSVGLLAWATSIGWVEEAAAHRIEGLSVPIREVGASMLLAVGAASLAAWLPARIVADVPVLQALSSRPVQPLAGRKSLALSLVLIAVGVTSLGLAHGDNARLIVAGMVATPIGTLLLAPFVLRALARPAARLPIAGRLAVRDLIRYQARSAAALAAIGLALGIAVSVVIVASAEKATADEGNLADHELLISTSSGPEPFVVPELTPAAVDDFDQRVADFAATLDDAHVLVLDLPVDPDRPVEQGLVAPGELQGVELGWSQPEAEHSNALTLYVATPELFEEFGADPGSVDAHDYFASDTTGSFFQFMSGGDKRGSVKVDDVGKVGTPGYESLPRAFVSPAFLESAGWDRARAGWLVETASALTSDQRAAAVEWAADNGLRVETRDSDAGLVTLQTGATAVGMLLALGILAMTIGLIRGEAGGDLRTLAAAGASSTIRRSLTAATAATLALVGVVLGVAGAYLVMAGAYLDDLGDLGRVPVVHLAVIGLGVPVLAAASSWVLAGRQPPTIARQAIE